MKPRFVIGFTISSVWFGAAALAGDINPPPGPVEPTMKTLDEVEARIPIGPETTPGNAAAVHRITEPGSYYLTGDVIGEAGKSGIQIFGAGDVTLDLNGYAVVGVPSSVDGISVVTSRATIRNGVVSRWDGFGLVDGQLDSNIIVERVRVHNCQQQGIQVGGGSIVKNCVSWSNGFNGIVVGNGSRVIDSVARNNGANGVTTSDNASISGSVASFNSSNGFVLGDGASIEESKANNNGNDGILTSINGGVVERCSSRANGQTGIRARGDALVRESYFGNNPITGVRVQGSGNRIEGNMVNDNGTGVIVAAPGNFVIRNTVSGNNLNWNVVSGNVIFVVNANTSGAFFGNSGGASPGSTNPNANYTY